MANSRCPQQAQLSRPSVLYIGGGGGGDNAFWNNLDIAESSNRDDVVHRSTQFHDVPKFLF